MFCERATLTCRHRAAFGAYRGILHHFGFGSILGLFSETGLCAFVRCTLVLTKFCKFRSNSVCYVGNSKCPFMAWQENHKLKTISCLVILLSWRGSLDDRRPRHEHQLHSESCFSLLGQPCQALPVQRTVMALCNTEP